MKNMNRKDRGWKPIHYRYKVSKKKRKHKAKRHLKPRNTRTPKVDKK
jgi:hypothetical protein